MEKKVIKTDYFTLVIQDGKAKLTTDYNPEVVTAARRLNGKWQAYEKVWQFDSRDEDRIKTFLKEIFGTDGEAPADLVDVKIYFKKLPSQAFEYNYGASAFALGRQITHRPRRDAKVRLGNNVSILAGGFPSSGGSAKNPRLAAEEGTILLVRDVPRTVLEKDEMACNDCYEIVNDPNPPKSVPVKPEAPAPDDAADVYAYYPADLIQKLIEYYADTRRKDRQRDKGFVIAYLRSFIVKGANRLAKLLRYVGNEDTQTFFEYITGKSGLVSLKDRGEAFKAYYGIEISKAATQEEIIPILKQETSPRQTMIPSAQDTPSPFLDIMERMASRMPMLATISGWQETADRIKKGDVYQVLGTNILNELLLTRVVPVITNLSIDLDITQLREAYTYALEPYGDKGDYAIIRRTLDEAVEARKQAVYQRNDTIQDLTAEAYQVWSETRTVAQNKHSQLGIRIPFQDLEAVLPRPSESQGLDVLRLAEAQHEQVRSLDSEAAFMAYFTELGYKPPVRDEQEPDTRPGDYFVSVIQDTRDPKSPRKMLLGPFQTHEEALDKVDAVKTYTREKYKDSAFYAFGTARAEVGSGIKGALNEQMGFGDMPISENLLKKYPWEMTYQEFYQNGLELIEVAARQDPTDQEIKEYAEDNSHPWVYIVKNGQYFRKKDHFKIVQKALEDGLPVPLEVQEYWELGKYKPTSLQEFENSGKEAHQIRKADWEALVKAHKDQGNPDRYRKHPEDYHEHRTRGWYRNYNWENSKLINEDIRFYPSLLDYPDVLRATFVNKLHYLFRNGTRVDAKTIAKLQKEYHIDDPGYAYELAELAWTGYYRKIVREYDLHSTIGIERAYGAVLKFYQEQQPVYSYTDQSKKLYQQYSTPAPLSFLAGYFCEIHLERETFEPSAGNGLLVFMGDPARTDVNEIDVSRRTNLRETYFRRVTDLDATLPFDAIPDTYDAVLTNPPFSNLDAPDFSYNGYRITKLEHLMAAHALQKMKDTGRAAIIIGGHMEYDDKGSIRAHKPFFNWLFQYYYVADLINIESKVMYRKQGTTFPVRMILIAGRKPAPSGYPPLVKSEDHPYARVESDYDTLCERVRAVKRACDITSSFPPKLSK